MHPRHEITRPCVNPVDFELDSFGHVGICHSHGTCRREFNFRSARLLLAVARTDLSFLLQSFRHVKSMHWLLSILIFIAYSFACLGWGLLIALAWSRYWRGVANDDGNLSVDFSIGVASCFLTGIALCSALLTVLGLIGQLRPLPLILILSPGVIGIIVGRVHWARCRDAILRALSTWRVLPGWLLAIVGFTALLAFGCGIGAWVLPPKGDAAAFYFVYPKIIAATGLLEPMHGPLRFFSAIGLPVELHYAALMVLADEHAAKLLMFPIALSVGVMLAGIVRLCGGGVVAVSMSWAMLFSSYTFHHYIFDGKVDLAAAAFGLAAVYWLLLGRTSKLSAAYVAAGWFAGLATVAKFSYFLVLGVSLSVLLIWQLGVNRPQGIKFGAVAKKLVRLGAVMAFAAVFAWLPQLIKNSVFFSAPLAPFVGDQGGGNWLNQVWFSPEATTKILLTYPFALVFGRYPMQGGGLSFLFLAFLPFVFWLERPLSWRRSTTTAVTVAAFAAVIAWMLLRPSVIAPRYILAPLLMFVPILAIAVETVLCRRSSQRLLRTGVALSVMMAVAASFWHLLAVPSVIFAKMTDRDTSCLQASSECESWAKLTEVARPGERIMVASYYPYWLTPSHLQCRDTLEEQREIPDQTQLVPWLKSHGFAYVAVAPSVSQKLATDLQQLAAGDAPDIHELSSGQALKLYGIENDLPGRMRCVESLPGRWYLQKDSS